MDIHAALWGIKFLVCLWRCAPLKEFPINRELMKELSSIEALFSESVEICLAASPLSEGWKKRTRDHLQFQESEMFDHESLTLWLLLHSESPGNRGEFSFSDSSQFKTQTMPIWEFLILQIASSICPQQQEPRPVNPLKEMEKAVEVWIELCPSAFFENNSSGYLRSLLSSRHGEFSHPFWIDEYLSE